MEKINIFGGNLLKKYSKIAVIYEVKISVYKQKYSKIGVVLYSIAFFDVSISPSRIGPESRDQMNGRSHEEDAPSCLILAMK